MQSGIVWTLNTVGGCLLLPSSRRRHFAATWSVRLLNANLASLPLEDGSLHYYKLMKEAVAQGPCVNRDSLVVASFALF